METSIKFVFVAAVLALLATACGEVVDTKCCGTGEAILVPPPASGRAPHRSVAPEMPAAQDNIAIAAEPETVTTDEVVAVEAGLPPQCPEFCNFQQKECWCTGETEMSCTGLTGNCVEGRCEEWSGSFTCDSPAEGWECVGGTQLRYWSRSGVCGDGPDQDRCPSKSYQMWGEVQCYFGCVDGASECNSQTPDMECPEDGCPHGGGCGCDGNDKICGGYTGVCMPDNRCESTTNRTACAEQTGRECQNNRLVAWHGVGCEEGQCTKQFDEADVVNCYNGCTEGSSECTCRCVGAPGNYRCQDDQLIYWWWDGACTEDGQCARVEAPVDPPCPYGCFGENPGDAAGCRDRPRQTWFPPGLEEGDSVFFVYPHHQPVWNNGEVDPQWYIDTPTPDPSCQDQSCMLWQDWLEMGPVATPRGGIYLVVKAAAAPFTTFENPLILWVRYNAYWQEDPPNLPVPSFTYETWKKEGGLIRMGDGTVSVDWWADEAQPTYRLGRTWWNDGSAVFNADWLEYVRGRQ